MFAVAAMNGGGHDVPTDRVTAQRWFRKAAELGHPQAQMMLGRYLYRGLTGERDIEQARSWLEKALAQGVQEVKADLAELPPPPVPPEPAPEPAFAQGRRRANRPPVMHGPGPDAKLLPRAASLGVAMTEPAVAGSQSAGP
jgi:TPR repeat protein